MTSVADTFEFDGKACCTATQLRSYDDIHDFSQIIITIITINEMVVVIISILSILLSD